MIEFSLFVLKNVRRLENFGYPSFILAIKFALKQISISNNNMIQRKTTEINV